jgi:hypothetical protein
VKNGETCAVETSGSIVPKSSNQHDGVAVRVPLSQPSSVHRSLTSFSSFSSSTTVNTLHLRLFDHFRVATAETLIFGPEVWLNKVLPMSFEVGTEKPPSPLDGRSMGLCGRQLTMGTDPSTTFSCKRSC